MLVVEGGSAENGSNSAPGGRSPLRIPSNSRDRIEELLLAPGKERRVLVCYCPRLGQDEQHERVGYQQQQSQGQGSVRTPEQANQFTNDADQLGNPEVHQTLFSMGSPVNGFFEGLTLRMCLIISR
jgi:hypothetical protein